MTFDDTAAGNTSPILIAAGGVQPASVALNNNVLAYSFSGGAIGGAATVTLSGTAGVVFYNANTYTGGTYLKSAELLQLGPGASLGTGALTVNAGTLDLGGNSQAVTNLNGVAGIITSSVASPVTLTVSPTASSAFGGLLQNGSGTLSLAMNGPSLLTLSGTNSYSGGTTISGGTLSIAADSALGTAPAAPATNLTLNGGVLSFANTMTLKANRTISLGANGGTFSVSATNATSPDTAPPGPMFAGQITGPGGLTITGGSASNTSAIATVTAGYVFVIDGSNNNYQGNTTVNNATLTDDAHVLGGTAVNILPATTVLTLANSAVFTYYGGTSAQTLAGLSGDSTTAIGTENNNNPTSLTINPAAGQSYTYAGVIGDVAVNGRGHAGTGGAPLNVTFSGLGTEVLSGTKLDTGSTTITSGTVELANVSALANGVVAVNAVGNGLVFASGLGTANVGGLSGSGNIALADLSGGSLTLNVSGANNTNYSGALSGIGGLTNGGGTLTLSGSANNYSGPTLVSGGVLIAANTGAVPGWQTLNKISVSNAGSTFTVQGGTAAGEFSAGNIAVAASNVSFGAGTNLGIQVVNAAPFTLANSISGASGLREVRRRHADHDGHQHVRRTDDCRCRHVATRRPRPWHDRSHQQRELFDRRDPEQFQQFHDRQWLQRLGGGA